MAVLSPSIIADPAPVLANGAEVVGQGADKIANIIPPVPTIKVAAAASPAEDESAILDENAGLVNDVVAAAITTVIGGTTIVIPDPVPTSTEGPIIDIFTTTAEGPSIAPVDPTASTDIFSLPVGPTASTDLLTATEAPIAPTLSTASEFPTASTDFPSSSASALSTTVIFFCTESIAPTAPTTTSRPPTGPTTITIAPPFTTIYTTEFVTVCPVTKTCPNGVKTQTYTITDVCPDETQYTRPPIPTHFTTTTQVCGGCPGKPIVTLTVPVQPVAPTGPNNQGGNNNNNQGGNNNNNQGGNNGPGGSVHPGGPGGGDSIHPGDDDDDYLTTSSANSMLLQIGETIMFTLMAGVVGVYIWAI